MCTSEWEFQGEVYGRGVGVHCDSRVTAPHDHGVFRVVLVHRGRRRSGIGQFRLRPTQCDQRVVPATQIGVRLVAGGGPPAEPGLVVNGEPIFCRGGGWVPLDPVGLSSGSDDVRAALDQVRGAGLNMLRTVANTIYPSIEFHQLCDELGGLLDRLGAVVLGAG